MFFGGQGFPFPPQSHQRRNANVDTHALYKALEIEKSVSDTEVKKAFRKLALRKHPDKGGDPEEFKKIQAAYEVLSDPEKRKRYDEFGLEGLNDSPMTAHGDDIFDVFFGGGMRRTQQRRTPDAVHKLRVSLEDLYNGKTSKIAITRTVLKGEPKTCTTCNGRGSVSHVRKIGPGMVQQLQSKCPHCAAGFKAEFEKERKILEIAIEKGIPNKSKLRFSEMGNESPNTKTGDVIFVIEQIEHPTFKRRGDDLIIHKEINLIEALAGVSFVIKHLDGRSLRLNTQSGSVIHPPNSKIGSHVMCVQDEGMPKKGTPFEKGNLFVVFSILFPKTLTETQVNMLKTAFHDTHHASDASDAPDVPDTNHEIETLFMKAYAYKTFEKTNDDGIDDKDGEEREQVQCAQS